MGRPFRRFAALLSLSGASLLGACGLLARDEDDVQWANDDGDSGASHDGSTDALTSDAALPDSGVDAGRLEPSTQIGAVLGGACELKDSAVRCWGETFFGELGVGADPNDNQILLPTTVSISFSPTILSMQETEGCVTDGTHTSCWGFDATLGAPTGVAQVPLDAGGLGSIRALTVGTYVVCGIAPSGGVSCFGDGYDGALGTFDGGSTSQGQHIDGLPGDVVQVAVGRAFGCALSSTHEVYCWGNNTEGTLGRGPADAAADSGGDWDSHPVPQRIAGLSATFIAAADVAACAVLSDGHVACWGQNLYQGVGGGLGHDPSTDETCPWPLNPYQEYRCNPTPSIVAGVSDVREVATSSVTTCAVKNDDTVVCWGDNSAGQLAIAPTDGTGGTDSNRPPTAIAGLTNVAHVAVGRSGACAVTWDDRVLCWGSDRIRGVNDPDASIPDYVPVSPQGL